MDAKKYIDRDPTIKLVADRVETAWINPYFLPFAATDAVCQLVVSDADIEDAGQRLQRFAPFIEKRFPETGESHGVIESPLAEIPNMRKELEKAYGCPIPGRLLLKLDSHLAIAGSIKARGGIYEVLKHAEDLAIAAGKLSVDESYAKLAEPEMKAFFGRYTVQVGSTGNLGLSIGISGAALGFRVKVHMSADAKQWKKDLLRSKGVEVIEYADDYSKAVAEGRRLSDRDPMSYFVDDENSRDLFLGYSVAAERLDGQLKEAGVTVDSDHPLFVYIPCGVGGAPGGVSFGLKEQYGDNVHIFFVEPTQACCMLLGLVTGLHSSISVQDVGLSGQTHADGLAVGRPSGFVGGVMEPLLSGEVTVEDAKLYEYMRDLLSSEDLFIEPSACAAFQGVVDAARSAEMGAYMDQNGLREKLAKASHIVWATGGNLVPEEVRQGFINTYL